MRQKLETHLYGVGLINYRRIKTPPFLWNDDNSRYFLRKIHIHNFILLEERHHFNWKLDEDALESI